MPLKTRNLNKPVAEQNDEVIRTREIDITTLVKHVQINPFSFKFGLVRFYAISTIVSY